MHALRILYDDHRELTRRSGRLVVLSGSFCASRQQELLYVRQDLARLVREHLEREELLAVRPMRESVDPAHRALARRYVDDLLQMRLESAAHHAKWRLPAALADMAAYHASVRHLVNGLNERILWEEAEFLPVAEKLVTTSPLRRTA